jgi:hypothetical protein
LNFQVQAILQNLQVQARCLAPKTNFSDNVYLHMFLEKKLEAHTNFQERLLLGKALELRVSRRIFTLVCTV